MSGHDEIAGRLSERVLWQSAADAPDGGGGSTRIWTDRATLWAAITAMPITRQAGDYGHEPVARYGVTIRYRSSIGPGHRLIWRDRVLMIESVQDSAVDRQLLHLQCTSRQMP